MVSGYIIITLLPIESGPINHYACCVIAAAVGKPKARVPYSAISPSCVKGFPKGLKFGPPSSFSTESLRRIVDTAEDIAFTGMQTTFLTIVIIFTTCAMCFV